MIADGVLTELAGVIGDFDTASIESVGGGSINRCFALPGKEGTRYFLKTNSDKGEETRDMFAAEFAGLMELADAHCVRVPRPIGLGAADGCAWLLLEYLSLGRRTVRAEGTLGTLLARQHRCCAASFGWSRDNTIGSTPQRNMQRKDWIEFFGEQRLGFQLRLAADNGLAASLESASSRLLDSLPNFFENYRPEASLLHGDLWGGNWGVTSDGEPVCFDPAVYYGDRETDLAMTKLFGGFGPEFYAAYNDEWPLDAGFQQRCDLYNLYHVLNHLNLFGRGYLGQAESMLNGLLSQI